MGTLGFSYVGLLFLLMLFIPNILWARHKPDGYGDLEKTDPRSLLLLERVGQVLVTACSLCFSDFNLQRISPWTVWLAAAFLLMLLYEIIWRRYLTGAHTLTSLYGDQFHIPVPLATLPVAAFLLLGVYGKVIWLILSATVLGIGHIGIHLRHRKTVLHTTES